MLQRTSISILFLKEKFCEMMIRSKKIFERNDRKENSWKSMNRCDCSHNDWTKVPTKQNKENHNRR